MLTKYNYFEQRFEPVCKGEDLNRSRKIKDNLGRNNSNQWRALLTREKTVLSKALDKELGTTKFAKKHLEYFSEIIVK